MNSDDHENKDPNKDPDKDPSVVKLPFSRLSMASKEPPRDLGLSVLSKRISSAGRNPKGHWCGRCRGIWYTYFLEAECPVCGNRHG